MKRCNTCKETKENSEFSLNKKTENGITRSYVRSSCKKCHCQMAKDRWYRNHIPKPKKAAVHPGKPGTKDYNRSVDLKGRFGITLIEYNQMFLKQSGFCAICNRHQSEFKLGLAVDHNHSTGKIRGLLCSKCNTALGQFNDSIDVLEKAKTYLKKHI